MRNLLIVLLLIADLGVNAATNTAASASAANVQSAVNLCADGDTCIIPAGTATWATVVTITNAIVLQGNGIGSTIIKDGIPADTVMLQWTLVAGKASRMTGIEFQDGGAGGVNFNGVITATGAAGTNSGNQSFRADHCYFNLLEGANLFCTDVLGVIDHCTFKDDNARICIYIYHSGWNAVAHSDRSWLEPAYWGSSNFLFIEDCTFLLPANNPYAICDAYRGARYVARYCTISNAWIEMHGTDSGGRERGTRAVEAYMNSFVGNDTTDYLLNCRSGSFLFWSNSIAGHSASAAGPQVHMDAYRRFYTFSPWGQADGTNGWDLNVGGSAAASGTVTSHGTLTITDNTKSWTVNQWVGYQVNNLTGGPLIHSASIEANTATQITYHDDGGYAFISGPLVWHDGDSYDIRQLTEIMDQPGRSGGSQLSGTTPSIPGGWNDQVDDPCYVWNNTGVAVKISAAAVTIRTNEHYFASAAPAYTAYTYPHPLVSGPPPKPIANLGKSSIGKGQIGK